MENCLIRTKKKSEMNIGEIPPSLTTLKLGTTSLLRLDVCVENIQLIAALDTGAEVTIISDKIYESLKHKPPTKRESIIDAAGRGMKMRTVVVGPVKLKLGSKFYETEVYVASISDDMLLGLNFMVAYGASVDLKKCTFNIGGENLDMSPGVKRTIPVVSKVIVEKR